METAQAKRIAETESLFRDVNERIAETAKRFGSEETEFVCECADSACAHRIDATLADYEDVRADGTRFIVAPGHVEPKAETVVARKRDFLIVAKVKGILGATARHLDPRAGET